MNTEIDNKKKPVQERVQRVGPQERIKKATTAEEFYQLMKDIEETGDRELTAALNTPADKRYPAEMLSSNQEIGDAYKQYKSDIRAVSEGQAGSADNKITPPRPRIAKEVTQKPTPKPQTPAEENFYNSAAAQEQDWGIKTPTPEERETPESIKSAIGGNVAKERKGKDLEIIGSDLDKRYTQAFKANKFPELLTFIQEISKESKIAKEISKPLYEEYLLKATQVLRANCEKTRYQIIGKLEKLDSEENILPKQYINLISKALLSLETQFNEDMRNSIAVAEKEDPRRIRMENLEKEKIALYSLLDRDAVRNIAAMLGLKRSIFMLMDPKLKEEFAQILQNDPYRKNLIQGEKGEISLLIKKWKDDIKNAAAVGNTELEKKLNNNILWAQKMLTTA